MRRILQQSRWMILVAVVFSLIAAAAAFVWGATKTLSALWLLWSSHGHDSKIGFSLIQLMDAFLIATGLLIFPIGLYELFVGELEVPGWLKFHDLIGLKSTLANVIVLLLAVSFLERYVEDAPQLVEHAVAATLVGGMLVVFGWRRK
jgi:uncharacterized membrane protein YqhA